MHFCKLDAYFRVAAQGNDEAYLKLYDEFRLRAKNTIITTINQNPNFAGNPEDFMDLIDKLFFSAINDYDAERGSFSGFVDYILTKRLANKVQNEIYAQLNTYAPLDKSFDGHSPIELIADPSQKPITSDIAVKNFRAQISSPAIHKTKVAKIKDRILLLQYAGYSIREICHELNLTMGQLRGYLKKIKEDDEIENFNLEMK